jgi:hypothetical protein
MAHYRRQTALHTVLKCGGRIGLGEGEGYMKRGGGGEVGERGGAPTEVQG